MTGGALGGLLAALLLAAALAGCSEPEATVVEVAPGQTLTVSEAPKPELGIVSGIVGDDALYPLGGVALYIVGLNHSTQTDENGRFAILDVPPGIYLLEGQKKDHATTQTTVDVRGGEVAKAVLLLPRVPSTDPYHTTWKKDDRIGMLVVDDNGSTSIGFLPSTFIDVEIEPSLPLTLVAESLWSGVIVSGGTRPPLLYELSAVGRQEPLLTAEASNPFSVHIDARILPPGFSMYRLVVFTDLVDPVVVDAATQTFVTVFYNEPAPSGWSVIAGSV